LRGVELMQCIINYMDRAKLAGLRDTPEDLPYYPGPDMALGFGATRESGNG